jgi:transcriptional regulator with XRE-family HTH domain
MDRKLINEALFLARVYWQKSQAELAEELGISQPYLSEIESSKRNVDVALLDRYSKALKVPKSFFVVFSEELEGKPPARSSRYVVADWALRLLERLVPDETLKQERPSANRQLL